MDWAVIGIEIISGEPGGGLEQYTVDVIVSGAGNVALDPSGGTYFDGTEVILTATPDAGYQFDAWSGDLTGSENPDTIIVNGNKSINAAFRQYPQGADDKIDDA